MYGLLASAALLTVGLIWDLSWDMSFGRDSFWSPPHVAVNAGGFAAAAVALWWAIRVSRGGQAAAVSWGRVRMPVGAALVLWGSTAMLAAGALELAWSRAYGMAAGAWTPPQVLFTVALSVLHAGVLLAAASRSAAVPRWAVACAAGLALTFATLVLAPYSLPNLQHTALFFLLSSAVFPLLLAWTSRTRALPLTATAAAAVYTAIVCVMVWVLPFVPAHALIGPVFEKVHHMVPPRFPLLLLVPAFLFDRLAGGAPRPADRAWRKAVVLGVVFVAAFVLLQWNFAAFLLSAASDNAFFAGGGRHWPFYMDIGEERRQFWDAPLGGLTVATAAASTVVAMVAAGTGLALGRYTEGLRR